jgi:anti-sigma factor RsiW
MTCAEIRGLLDLVPGGDLPEDLSPVVERHLMRCAACSHEVRALERARALLRDACRHAEAPPSFRERTAARLLDEFADVLRSAPASDAMQRTLPLDE